MTADEWKKRLPNCSDDFLRRNASDYQPVPRRNDPPRDTGKAAVVERNPRHGALGTRKVQKRDTRKFLVRVTSFRKRLIDEDNLCEKFHVDLCRYSGMLPSDAAGKARVTTGQEKVGSDEDERIEIVIERIA